MITNFLIYKESYHERFKKFEVKLNYLRISKLHRRDNIKKYKYKKNDIVFHKELGRVFIVNGINDFSDDQDYYVTNPFDPTECGFVIEEELRDAKEEELRDTEVHLLANKYNL